MPLLGVHHVTAVTADIRRNHAFYTRTLGMRLVKRSVNQDDTSAYHLFYADARATPGSDLTFFDWPVPPETRGTRSVARTGLRLRNTESLDWWQARLGSAPGVRLGERHTRNGRAQLDFEDPEGQRLAFVADPAATAAHPWDRSDVPPEHQIVGLGPVWMSVPRLDATARVLTELLGMRETHAYTAPASHAGGGEATVHVFQMGDAGAPTDYAGADAELHVAIEPDAAPVRPGAGGVHHVAFRIADDEYAAWTDRLAAARVPSSGPVDRYYFRSLYFREPGGVLFELATDGPGFAVDEPMDTLGDRLALPPFLEPQRAKIEAGLKPL